MKRHGELSKKRKMVLVSFDQQPPSRFFTGRHVLIAVVCLPSLSKSAGHGEIGSLFKISFCGCITRNISGEGGN
jgi:hypothetical protein